MWKVTAAGLASFLGEVVLDTSDASCCQWSTQAQDAAIPPRQTAVIPAAAAPRQIAELRIVSGHDHRGRKVDPHCAGLLADVLVCSLVSRAICDRRHPARASTLSAPMITMVMAHLT